MNDLTRSWHDHQQPGPLILDCAFERDISELENAEAFDRFMLRFNQEFDRRRAISSLDPIFEHFDRARSIAAMRDDLPTHGVYDPRM